MQDFLEKHYRKIIVAILGFMLVVSVLNANNDSAIFDETAHIPAGYSYLTQHDMRLNPEHPPMLKDFAALPLLFMNLKFDTAKAFWSTDINGQWDAGRDLLWQEGNDADRIIFWSRLPIVILSIILGLFIFKWAKELAGISAGLFALALYAFDPNILGHNHFVTTDLGIAAFMIFSFYYFLKFIKNPSWKNMLAGGIFLGLLQLAKFNSITLFPIFGLVILIYPLAKKIRNENKSTFKFKLKKMGEYLGKGILAFAVSLVVVWGVYLVNVYKMPQEKLSQTIEYYFPQNDPSPNARMVNKVSGALNENIITRPLSEYFLGIAMVFKRVDGGNGAYFMGEVSSTAFAAYFPTVFALKEPLINLSFMLLALGISLLGFIKFITHKLSYHFGEAEKNSEQKNSGLFSFIQHNITSISMLGFIILYAYVSITGNLNIGFRHLFPILPFIYILIAKIIFDFIKKLNDRAQAIWHWIVIILTVFLISGTVAAYPAYMSYFNQLAGGSKNGYQYATDSNADWGQDLKRLQSWVKDYNFCSQAKCNPNQKIGCPSLCYDLAKQSHNPRVPIDKIHLNYFGGADIEYYFGDFAVDWWDSRRPIKPGWYAISTNYLMGSIYDKTKSDNESYRWTQNIKPVAQVGTSIFIYYLTPEEVADIK